MKNHKKLVNNKIKDEQLQTNLKNASYILQKNRKNTINTKFTDWDGLRNKAKNVKNNSLSTLKDRILEFEENATKNGIKVHFADTKEDACEIIYQLMQEKNITKALKGKSMASEEIELNDYLKKRGIQAIETDLGELIIQLEGEKPVHIVGPALHKNRYEIGEIFAKKLNAAKEDEPEKLNSIARKYLREHFKDLKLGISGVNIAISSKGAIWLVENEGNGRMCTSACDIHVAICGIEKIVKDFKDACTINTILATSAAGQFVSVYSNIITSPKKENDFDGPKEVHVILLNNNRLEVLKDECQYEVLRCIRCGVCANFCPVYNKIGGHAYDAVYSGPIGVVISSGIFGLKEHGDILSFCSLCGRCADACPVKIPLPDLIRKLRYEKVKNHKNAKEDFIFNKFATYATNGKKWRFIINNIQKTNFFINNFGKIIPIVKDWKAYKDLPKLGGDLYKTLQSTKGVIYE